MCDKVKSLCNIISKLAGTDWGAPAPVYSVAEYCVPVWGRCAHVQHIDTQLNIAMRTVSGALRPTNTNWLLVFSNIEPPQICRDRATLQEYNPAQQLADRVPFKEILREPPMSRLRSRRPFVIEVAAHITLEQLLRYGRTLESTIQQSLVITEFTARLRRLQLVSTLFHLVSNKTAGKPAREQPVITATTDATMIAMGSTIHVTPATRSRGGHTDLYNITG